MSDRFTVDLELHKAIPRGAVTRLAEFRGIAPKNVAKYYDPHNEDYQSPFSRALLELKTIAQVAPDWASNIVGVITRFSSEWAGLKAMSAETHNGVETIIGLAAKVQNPETKHADRYRLVVQLEREVRKLREGLEYQDLDGAEGDEAGD